jgi:hypothetical protein
MTARLAPTPRSEALEAGQRRVGDAGDDAVAACDYNTMLPESRCPRCAYFGPHRISPGTPPHHQRLSCGQCGRWLCWLPRRRPMAQGGRP